MEYFTQQFPSPEQVAADIAEHGYAVYPNAVQPEVMEELRQFWFPYFQNDFPKKHVVRGDLLMGSENFNSYTDSSFWCLYRDFEFLWNSTKHALTRDVTVAIHQFRNQIQNFDPDYGLKFSPDCYGVYISTSHYPPARGHLQTHTDGHKDVPILHYMLPISIQGQDYQSGGMIVIDKSGKAIDVDAQVELGSLVFFDGRMQHGVTPITPLAGKTLGRVATFAIPTFFVPQRDIPDVIRRSKYAIERGLSITKRGLSLLQGKPRQDSPKDGYY